MISVIVPVHNTEDYLEEVLDSILNQTYSDIEILVINDGSTDSSQSIIDRFSERDSRIRCLSQERHGVSSARNLGLDHATGDYVAFFDSDDFVPKDAIERLAEAVISNNADCAVGRVAEVYPSKTIYPKHADVLASKKTISRFDVNFLYSFSVWNKLFSRKLIESYHLRFEDLSNNEDGVFTFSFLALCPTIVGCNHVVYEYRRRPSWKMKSATQIGNADMMRESMRALERVKAIVEGMFDDAFSKLDQNEKDGAAYEELLHLKLGYLSSMYRKFLNISVLGSFYRIIWNSEDELIHYMNQKVIEFKSRVFPATLEKVQKQNRDIDLSGPLPSKSDIARNPIVSFLLSDNIPPNRVNTMIQSIYSQKFPSFALFVPERYLGYIDEFFRNQVNFVAIKEKESEERELISRLRSKYVVYFDEFMILDVDVIRKMHSLLEDKKKLGFVVAEVKSFDFERGISTEIPLIHILYEPKHSVSEDQSLMLKRFDTLLGNKMFRTPLFRKLWEEGSLSKGRGNRAYSFLPCGRVEETYFLSEISNEDLFARCNSRKARLLYKLHQLM